MRKLIIATMLFTSFSSFAGVRVTSFYFIANQLNVAEICGIVEGATAPSFVKIRVDHRGNKPGTYNAVASDEGKFCHVVVTYRGEAEVTTMGQSSTTTSSTLAEIK